MFKDFLECLKILWCFLEFHGVSWMFLELPRISMNFGVFQQKADKTQDKCQEKQIEFHFKRDGQAWDLLIFSHIRCLDLINILTSLTKYVCSSLCESHIWNWLKRVKSENDAVQKEGGPQESSSFFLLS